MRCTTCDGRGYVPPKLPRGYDPAFRIAEPCPDCGGTGAMHCLGEKVAQVDELYLEVKK